MKQFLGERRDGFFSAKVRVVDEFKNESKLLYHFKLERKYYHSPNGFEWGYGGSGPADLAYSILRDLGLTDEEAFPLYQDFKWDIIAKLPREGFCLDEAMIIAWLEVRGIKNEVKAVVK